jgi:hypothetical protein
VGDKDLPTFGDPAGLLLTLVPGRPINYQIEAFDLDPDTTLTYRLVGGSLPTGLKLLSTGIITGIPGAPADRISDDYREWVYEGPVERRDTYSQSFTVEISDGENTARRTFSIKILDWRRFTCDTTYFTADDDNITVDGHVRLRPVFLDGNFLGTYRHANYWIRPVKIYDPDGRSVIRYDLVSSLYSGYENDLVGYDSGFGSYDVGPSTGLPGISIDSARAILHGLLPTIPALERDYEFVIRASTFDEDGTFVWNQLTSFITLRGDIETAIQWVSPTELGTVTVGEPSQLYIQAQTSSTTQLFYKLTDGKLPPGMILGSNGLLIGVAGKRNTEIDNQGTTIDQGSMTLDRSYTFTVSATNAAGTIQDSKIFTVRLRKPVDGLFYNYWVKGLIDLADRAVWQNLVSDSEVIRLDNVYRLGDPNFGINHTLDTLVARGVKSVDPSEILQALNTNHARKTYYFGDIKWVTERNPNTNEIEYEVVYAELVDPYENANGSAKPLQLVKNSYGGESPLTVDSTLITADNTLVSADFTNVSLVFPPSTANMRLRLDQYLDSISQGTLPTWMRSLQESTQNRLGYTKAAVLCYVKPGQGRKTVNAIKNKYGLTLNNIHYQVDRYYVEPIYAFENPTTFDATFDFWLDSEITANKYFVFQNDKAS